MTHDEQREAFLLAIAFDRYDRATRMAYADWLSENGHDDEAAEQAGWTREKEEAKEYIESCAGECEVSYLDMMATAARCLKSSNSKDDWFDDYIICQGFDTPDSMRGIEIEKFWRAYELVTGATLDDERRGRTFVACSC